MLVFISKIRFAVALTFIEWYLYVAHQLVLAMLRYFLPSRKLTALVYVAQIYKAVQQSQRNIIERLYHCQFAYGADRAVAVEVFGKLLTLCVAEESQSLDVVVRGVIEVYGIGLQLTQQLVHLLRVASFYVVIVAEIVKELFP